MIKRVNIKDETQKNISNVFLVCPNFEERSIGFLDWIDTFENKKPNTQ